MFEDWMLTSAYGVVSILPTNHDEALAVLALAKQIILKVNRPYVLRLRDGAGLRGEPRKDSGKASKRVAARVSKVGAAALSKLKRPSLGRGGAARKRSAMSEATLRKSPR